MLERELWRNYARIADKPIDSPSKTYFIETHAPSLRDRLRQAQSPMITIVIPAHNEEAYLPRTLAGLNLALQSLPENLQTQVSIILVDNNSTDATPEIAQCFGVTVIHEPKKGIGYARQAGLEAVPPSAEFVLTTDADTLVSQGWIRNHRAILQQPEVVFTYGGIRFLPDTPLTLRQSIALFIYTIAAEIIHTTKNKAGIWIAGGANSGFRKDIALQIGGYNVHLAKGEDTDLMTRIAQHGKVVKVQNATVYTSARRIIGRGVLIHALTRLKSNIIHCLTKEVPVSTDYEDYRLI